MAKASPFRRAKNAKNGRFNATIAASPIAAIAAAPGKAADGPGQQRRPGQGDAHLLVGLDVQVGLDGARSV